MRSFILIISVLFSIVAMAQEAKEFLVISYNVENFLCPTVWRDSTLPTPSAFERVAISQFQQKAQAISASLRAYAQWDAIGIIGLCEVDDRRALNELVYRTPLSHTKWSILHRDSPDHRGIDVALLYQRELLHFRNCRWVGVRSEYDTLVYPTREMLYASFRVGKSDTIHFVLCHWPSKLSAATSERRIVHAAAYQLQNVLDSVRKCDVAAKIVVMGDMNTTPDDLIFQSFASPVLDSARLQGKLINLAQCTQLPYRRYPTYQYNGDWQTIDMFFLSPAICEGTGCCLQADAKERLPAFLFEPDLEYGGQRPKRTYYGLRFREGYSDHLPVSILLRYQ